MQFITFLKVQILFQWAYSPSVDTDQGSTSTEETLTLSESYLGSYSALCHFLLQ